MNEYLHRSIYPISTSATTRIAGWDAVSVAIGVAQTTYPADRPNAVLLTRPDHYPEVLSATRMLHSPFEGPLLFTEGERLEKAVARELIRLSPRGQGLPGQVVVVGAVHVQVLHDLAELGFHVWRLTGHDMWDTVERIAEYDIGGNRGQALLVSVDPLAGGVVAGGYAAFSGTPILFATEQGLLPSSVRFLQRHPRTQVFVAAPEAYLSTAVQREVRSLGSKVEGWIRGRDPFELSVEFARYRHGKARFGWGRRKQSGATLAVVPIDRWEFGVAAAALSYRGKKSPILLTHREQLPATVENGLLSLRSRGGKTLPLGILVGSLEAMSHGVQLSVHRALTGLLPS
jgi:hypothetical protein